MFIADKENAVFRDHLPHRPGSGTTKCAAKVALFYWFIPHFHFLIFPIPQALLVFPLIQRSSVFADFLPRLLICLTKYLHIFQRTPSAITCCKFPYCLIQKNSHWFSRHLFYSIECSDPFAMNFWLVQGLIVFSIYPVFHITIWVFFGCVCPPYQFKNRISSGIYCNNLGQGGEMFQEVLRKGT